jgi:hypothetical protein
MQLRPIYQHIPSRPSDESLVRIGSLQMNQDGSAVIQLDAIPLGEARLICLPSEEAVYTQPRQKSQLPTGATEAASRVK